MTSDVTFRVFVPPGARFTKRINSKYGVGYPGNGVNNSKLEATPFHKTGGWLTKRMWRNSIIRLHEMELVTPKTG